MTLVAEVFLYKNFLTATTRKFLGSTIIRKSDIQVHLSA